MHHTPQPKHQSKGYVMVRYMPLSNSSSSQYDTQGGNQATLTPLSVVSRCPKLSRYKVCACLAVLLLSLMLLAFTAGRSQFAQPYFSGGGGDQFAKDSSVLSAAASPMCSLRMPTDSNFVGSVPQSGTVEASQSPSTGQEQSPNSGGKVKVNPGPKDVGLHAYSSDRFDKRPGARRRRHFPSVIVIGARKAGTRAVLRFLDLHPDIVTCKTEPHFFDREYERGLEWYRHKMPFSTPSQITLEKTPNYFVDWFAPERVYTFNESIKLVLIVRDPISRAVSDYVQLREAYFKHVAETEENMDENGKIKPFPTFEQLVVNQSTGEIKKSYAPIKRSLYVRHLERWLAFFNMSQILVVDGDNVRNRPWEEVAKIEQFLGVPHEVKEDCFIFNKTKGFFCINMVDHRPGKDVRLQKCLAESKGREHPTIDPFVKRKLRDFFRPFNRRFFHRIGRTFDWE